MIGALRIGVEYLAQTVIGLRLRGAVIAGRCAGQEQQGNQKKQNRQRPGCSRRRQVRSGGLSATRWLTLLAQAGQNAASSGSGSPQ